MGIDPIPGQVQKHTLSIQNQRVVFGIAGTIHVAKGLDTVSAAFLSPDLLHRDDYRLEIFGDGDADVISELLERNPNVHWHGPYQSADLPTLLADVDVGLSTSRFETFHRVTREYLFSGIPVIGSLAFGIPEAVQHGVNGILFDHARPESFLRAVLSCLDDRDMLRRLTQGARATEIRSVGDEVEDLQALYDEFV
jgi:glycosyltransferase involved in cell wall biosynthesis